MKNIFISLCTMCAGFLFAQSFTEVSQSAGISHLYQNHSAMGGGAIFADFDNDGWEDLYISGGKTSDKLYMNNQNGGFTDISTSSGITALTANEFTVGAVAGDFDDDGYRDIFILTWFDLATGVPSDREPNLLLKNNGNQTFQLDMQTSFPNQKFTMAAATLDYNKDGFLDLYVGNYVETPAFLTNANNQQIGYDHDCFSNELYVSNAGNSFTESATTLGVTDPGGCTLAVMTTDFDQDNDVDIMVANDFGEFITPNKLFQNNGSSFTDVSASSGANAQMYAMGIASGDYDKDGDFDYYITNLGRNQLLQQNNGNFTDVATAAGVENTFTPDGNGMEFNTTGWGTDFVDINNDTWPDLVVSNGRVPALSFNETGETDPNKLFVNNGNGTFTDNTVTAGIGDANRSRGMASSDFDKDGDVDFVFIVQDDSAGANAKTLLYRNDLNPSSLTNANYVQFLLQGVTSNFDAIGAIVKVTAAGETLVQEVKGGGTHAGMHSSVLHFGLGTTTTITQVEIIWPNGVSQIFNDAVINKRFKVIEGQVSLATNEVVRTKGLEVYPNPVQNNFKIKGLDSKASYRIKSVLGQQLKSGTVSPEMHIDLTGLASGSYFLELQIQGQIQTHKIIKR